MVNKVAIGVKVGALEEKLSLTELSDYMAEKLPSIRIGSSVIYVVIRDRDEELCQSQLAL